MDDLDVGRGAGWEVINKLLLSQKEGGGSQTCALS